MIVLDTSAIIAVVFGEPEKPTIEAFLEGAGTIAMSAGTLTETLIVAGRRESRMEAERLLTRLKIEIVPVEAEGARAAADAHDRWGRGRHPAGLNFGDCFAYSLAKARGWPLLYVGRDFARTDVAPALAAPP